MKVFAWTIGLLITGFYTQNASVITSQSWVMNLIIINTDTVFYNGQPEFTYRHNFKLNQKNIKTKEDSLKVLESAKDRYEKSASQTITFLPDSTFLMTKNRGGWKIYPAEKDTGTYKIARDTIFMTERNKDNYFLWLVVDKSGDKIFNNGGISDHMIYMEYKKEK